MKLKFKKKHAHRLSKFDMFAGRYIEHDYNDEGQLHPTQLYPYQILNGKIKNITLSKYHLIKKFGEKKKELSNYTTKKNTKYLKQLIRIHYFVTLVKKTYHLIKALKKAKKALKVWIRQMIQNEIYFLKKAIKLAKTKAQLNLIYIKYKIVIKTYQKIYIKFMKNIIKRYLKKTKKIKKQWKKVLTHGFTKGLKQKNNIMPLIFYIRKILFKKVRTGTLKEIRYWKKIIHKFAKRHKITKEFDLNNLINITTSREQPTQIKKDINIKTIKPYLLLNYLKALKKKSRPVLTEKIRKEFYQHLMNLVKKAKKKKKFKLKKKKTKFQRLVTFYSLICGKKKHIQRKSYQQRRLLTYINRLAQKQIIRIDTPIVKKKVENTLTLYKTISAWLILLKNWKRSRLFRKLTKIKQKNNRQYNFRKRRRITYKIRKILNRLNKRKKKKVGMLHLIKKTLQNRKNKIKIRIFKHKSKKKNKSKKIFKFKKRKRIKSRRRIRSIARKLKSTWRIKMRRIAYKTPYILSCQLYRDYTGNWIELYKKKNKYNNVSKSKITDQMTSKIMNRKVRRIIRKNYRHLLNDRYTIQMKHKEILLQANRYFSPITL